MDKKLSEMTLEELWELFPIILTEHQVYWKDWYEEEAGRLKDLLKADWEVRISHIGSTAVETIWAKPIVDILVEVPKDSDLEAVKAVLVQNGYICMSQGEKRISFNKGYTENGFAKRVFHLHLRYAGDNDELYFRDFLLKHSDVAKKYEALKLELWKKYEHDRDGYTAAKAEFVRKYTQLAMQDIKMIVTDLDGTYLKDDKSVSEYTKSVIDRLRAKGIKFVIATARPVRAVRDFLPEVQYDAGAFHNGAVIMEKAVRVGGMGVERATELIARILQERPKAHIAAEVDDWLYANFDAETIWPGIEYTYTADFAQITGMTADKLIIEAHSLEEMEQYQRFLPQELYLRLSENVIAMIMNQAATKSNSIRLLVERYGITMEQVVAFGDDYNDMDMLQACGRGIAVANALEAVKEVADEVCGSNAEDGMAKWLEKALLSQG